MKQIHTIVVAIAIILALMVSCKPRTIKTGSLAPSITTKAESQEDSYSDQGYDEEFDNAGEAIAGYSDEGRSTIYEYTFSGQLYNSTESHIIVLTYVLFPVDEDDDGWFDVSGDYRYPEWQKNKSFTFEGKTNMQKLVLFTENSEIFDLVKYDDGFVLKGDWYKYKSNQDRERDTGLWIKHLKVQLQVDKDYPLD